MGTEFVGTLIGFDDYVSRCTQTNMADLRCDVSDC